MSAPAPKFKGKIKSGKLILDNPIKYANYIFTLKGVVEVVVRPWDYTRSVAQNRYYRGIIVPAVVKWTGYTDKEAHCALKFKFSIKSTASLTSAEFEEYCENIRRWAALEHNLIIPMPNEVDFPEDTEMTPLPL